MLPKNKVQSSTSHTTNDTNRTISPERIAKMERILSTRQPTLSMFLEDVHNPHNASAVMRSCDAV
ncbi:RNA methyltransferase [bacterium]|nr:RNA methyltransferase [bacterium]